MRGLDLLREAAHPGVPHDPADGLLTVAKSLQGAAQAPTEGAVPVALAGLRVDPDYQRPEDRDKIKSMLHRLRGGGHLDPIKVNRRHDGSLWITDGQHRAAARTQNGETHAEAVVTELPTQEEAQSVGIMAKVASDRDLEAISVLLGLGARRDGKRVVLSLGAAGQVAYTPHQEEWAAKSERGRLTISGNDPADIAKTLELTDLVT